MIPSASQIAQRGADRRTAEEREALRRAPTTRSGCARCGWSDDRTRSLTDARRAFEAHPCTVRPKATRAEQAERLLSPVRDGMSARAAAIEVGVSVRTGTRYVNAARERGVL